MDFRAIFNLFLIIGVLQGFIFNVATFLLRKRIEKTVIFLNLFVLFLSLNNLQAWLVDKQVFPTEPLPDQFLIPWYILIVPAFYAFLINFLGIDSKRHNFLGLTLIFFIAATGIKFWLSLSVEAGIYSISTLESYNLAEDALVLAYSLFFYVKSIRLIYKYDQLYSPVLDYDDLNWIKIFLKLGGVVFIFWAIAVALNTFTVEFKPPYTYYPLRLTSTVLIYWVGYQAFIRYVLLKDRIQLRRTIRSSGPNTSGNINPIESDKSQQSFQQINQFLATEKLYLNPYLSQELFAETLGIGTSTLSKIVNENYEGNFSDYINNFRVEEAKKILLNKDFENYTIVAIALECGFNSKSTFYTAFKKYTGVTPSNFKAKPTH